MAHQVDEDALQVEAGDKDAEFKQPFEGDGLVELRHLLDQARDGHLLQGRHILGQA